MESTMGVTIERERKFLMPLMKEEYRPQTHYEGISQFYLSLNDDNEVRVRTITYFYDGKAKVKKCFITRKDILEGYPLTRNETEIEIPVDAGKILFSCVERGFPYILYKKRYPRLIYMLGDQSPEILSFNQDVYYHLGEPFISMAEIEFSSDEAAKVFTPPESIFGREVTDDPRYWAKNIYLALHTRNTQGYKDELVKEEGGEDHEY